MEYEKLKQYIEQNLSQREIAIKERVSQATIKYYLNKFNLKNFT